jgi:hypothetical protein
MTPPPSPSIQAVERSGENVSKQGNVGWLVDGFERLIFCAFFVL